MNMTTTFEVILSPGEIADLLKKAHPDDVRLVALPSNGRDLYITVHHNALSLTHQRRVHDKEAVVKLRIINDGGEEL